MPKEIKEKDFYKLIPAMPYEDEHQNIDKTAKQCFQLAQSMCAERDEIIEEHRDYHHQYETEIAYLEGELSELEDKYEKRDVEIKTLKYTLQVANSFAKDNRELQQELDLTNKQCKFDLGEVRRDLIETHTKQLESKDKELAQLKSKSKITDEEIMLILMNFSKDHNVNPNSIKIANWWKSDNVKWMRDKIAPVESGKTILKVGRFELFEVTGSVFNGSPTIKLKTITEDEGTTIDLDELFEREM